MGQTDSLDAIRQLIREELARLQGGSADGGPGAGNTTGGFPAGPGAALLPGATAQGFPAVATASGGGTPAPPTARDGLRRLPRPGAGQRNQTADAAGGQKAKGAGAPQQDAAQQISQELAQNLQKLKLVIQETQQIARKMEAILGESAGQSGY